MWRRVGWAGVFVVGVAVPQGVDGQAVPLDGEGWSFAGDAATGIVDGRPSLNLRIGEADRDGLTLGDGTIEFDMLVSSARTFVGLKLRVGPDGTYEDIYFRPHKSGLPDAIQYNPAYRGYGQWQLHHGPESTAFAHYTPGEWQRVRVELSGPQAAVFVGDGRDPALVIPRLRTGRVSGGFGFWANRPGATADDPWTVSIADLRITPGVTSWSFSEPEPVEREPGVVTAWELRAEAPVEAASLDALPAGLDDGDWDLVAADPSGLVEIQRHLPRPEAGPATALARIRLRAARARTVRLDLGFSDEVTVFLDGRPVYSGRFGYVYNFPRQDGLITLDQATVHLPVEPGEHEVVVAVSDVFGGWGLMGRILDRDGITVLVP